MDFLLLSNNNSSSTSLLSNNDSESESGLLTNTMGMAPSILSSSTCNVGFDGFGSKDIFNSGGILNSNESFFAGPGQAGTVGYTASGSIETAGSIACFSGAGADAGFSGGDCGASICDSGSFSSVC